MKLKDRGFWFLAFGLTYIFFGLTLILDDYSIDVKQLTGGIAVICGAIFFGIAIIFMSKKENKK